MPIVEFVEPVLAAGPATLSVANIRTPFAALAGRPTSWGTTNGSGVVTNPDVPAAVQEVTVTDVAGVVNTFHLDYTVLRSHAVRVFGGPNIGTGVFKMSLITSSPPNTNTLPGGVRQKLGGVFVTADGDNEVFSGISDADGAITFSWDGADYFLPGTVPFVLRGAKAGYVPVVIAGATFEAPFGAGTAKVWDLELQPLPVQPSGPVLLELSLVHIPLPPILGGLGTPWRAASAIISGDDPDVAVSFNSRGVASVSLDEGEYDISFSSPFYEVDGASPIPVVMELPGPQEVIISVTASSTPTVRIGTYKYRFLAVGRVATTALPPAYKYRILNATAWLANDALGQDPAQTATGTGGGTTLLDWHELHTSGVYAEVCVSSQGMYYLFVDAVGYEPICGLAVRADEIGALSDFDWIAHPLGAPALNLHLLTMDETRDRDDLTRTLNIVGQLHGHTVGPGTSIEVFSDAACTTKIAGPVSPDANGVLTIMVTNPCWVKGFDAGGEWGPTRVDFLDF